MLLIHGVYHLARRTVAYRNDYCRACDAPRRAFRHRTFDVLHFFWIPVLPLGLWKRWHCSTCGNDPHEAVRTRRGMMWLGVACLVLFSAAFWAHSPGQEPALVWSLRLGGLLATGLAARAALRAKPEGNFKERLRAIQPIMESSCPACHVMLVPDVPCWKCPKCGMVREALPVV
jgi:hypothetical protein